MTIYADNIAQELDRVIKAQEKLTAKLKDIRRSVLINDGVVSPQMAEEASDLEKAWVETRQSVEENLKRLGRERWGVAALENYCEAAVKLTRAAWEATTWAQRYALLDAKQRMGDEIAPETKFIDVKPDIEFVERVEGVDPPWINEACAIFESMVPLERLQHMDPDQEVFRLSNGWTVSRERYKRYLFEKKKKR